MARRHVEGQLGLFRPDTSWTVPTELPDLRGRPVVALDTETRDEGLSNDLGPGWALGPMGYICGVSWAAEDSVGYAPIRHPDTECMDQDRVMEWVADLHRSGTRIVFHNGPYDVGWLGTYGVPPPVLLDDTLAAEVMLDENHRVYNLDACCARRGIPGKDQRLMEDAVEAYGGRRSQVKADLWRLPARYVGPYAEQDGVATLGLWRLLEPQLRAQGVWDAYRLEMDLVPMVVAMRRRGIRIDQELAVQTGREFREQSARHLQVIGDQLNLRRPASMEELRSPIWMEKRCTELGVSFPRTAPTRTGRTQGSFTKEWMEHHEHWFPSSVTQALKFEEAATKFVDNFLLGFLSLGRIHAEVHQFRSDEGGTRSHRFSYSEPPLQQMPSPDKDPREDLPDVDGRPPSWGKGKGALIEATAVGTRLRRCFLPEEGQAWLAADYSQQEPRMTVHFAAACGVAGADAAVQRYALNPKTDYHTMVAEMTGKPRPIAKILNLALTYGKGVRSLAEELGVSLEEAKTLLEEYHSRLPFIKALENTAKNRAQSRGFIRLLDGARMHYNQWEGGWMEWEARQAAIAEGYNLSPGPLDEIRQRLSESPAHPWNRTRLRRADTRKALNNLIQGSAARQTKLCMAEAYRQGILPMLQMHDELDVSVGSREEVERVGQIMRDTVPLLVPVIVDLEIGPSWGTAKMSWDEYEAKYGRAA